ncbi:MAG: hypothetical protein ACXIVE_18445 [Salinarimonas sp.]
MAGRWAQVLVVQVLVVQVLVGRTLVALVPAAWLVPAPRSPFGAE